jgi:hypothetical protein
VIARGTKLLEQQYIEALGFGYAGGWAEDFLDVKTDRYCPLAAKWHNRSWPKNTQNVIQTFTCDWKKKRECSFQ